MSDLFSVEGHRVLITGGASGIGLAIARGFAERGAKVAIVDIDQDRLDRVVQQSGADGWDIIGDVLDVADSAATEKVFTGLTERLGGLDSVFANAGIDSGPGGLAPGPGWLPADDEHRIENYGDDRWHRVIDISLNGVFYSIRAAVRQMRRCGGGSIVVTTSISALRPAPSIGAAYAAAKAGAAQMVRQFALETAKDNIRVNAIAPGAFVTNIAPVSLEDPEVQGRYARNVPMGRMASPDEILGPALLLTTEAGRFITGSQLVIDGGASLSSARN